MPRLKPQKYIFRCRCSKCTTYVPEGYLVTYAMFRSHNGGKSPYSPVRPRSRSDQPQQSVTEQQPTPKPELTTPPNQKPESAVGIVPKNTARSVVDVPVTLTVQDSLSEVRPLRDSLNAPEQKREPLLPTMPQADNHGQLGPIMDPVQETKDQDRDGTRDATSQVEAGSILKDGKRPSFLEDVGGTERKRAKQ